MEAVFLGLSLRKKEEGMRGRWRREGEKRLGFGVGEGSDLLLYRGELGWRGMVEATARLRGGQRRARLKKREAMAAKRFWAVGRFREKMGHGREREREREIEGEASA